LHALILAAGYGTRLYPLTVDRPKALLPVGGKPVINHLVEQIEQGGRCKRVIVITNDKFEQQFRQWQRDLRCGLDIEVLSDGTDCNEKRLGAVGDMALAVKMSGIDDDLLVAASDHIFCFSWAKFFQFFEEKETDCVTAQVVNDVSLLRKTGVMELDGERRVISFEEKPAHPRSHFACPPVYLFRKETLPLFAEFLNSGGNPDAPGYFIAWLVTRKPVHAFLFDEPRYDIGDLESYRIACAAFDSPNRRKEQ